MLLNVVNDEFCYRELNALLLVRISFSFLLNLVVIITLLETFRVELYFDFR